MSITLEFHTVGARKIFRSHGPEEERRSGPHPLIEDYYHGNVTVFCTTEEREQFETDTERDLDSQEVGADDFALLLLKLAEDAGLKLAAAKGGAL